MAKVFLCSMLTAAVLFCGCASTRPSGEAAAGPDPISITSKSMIGVVLVKRDGAYVYYKNKCEHCGHVEGKVHRLLGPSKGKAIVSAFLCEKCGQGQQIRIPSE